MHTFKLARCAYNINILLIINRNVVSVPRKKNEMHSLNSANIAQFHVAYASYFVCTLLYRGGREVKGIILFISLF